ncbi:mucin-2-like [Trichomycterus rosablanca]|uniref:mucin-2-like n=1 Tax=Trichomycterus rosablanca TaxID=2290929 RepID=UPI002F34FC53
MEWSTCTLCVLVLAMTCGLQVNAIKVHQRNHVDNICSIWGNFHFKTFDGDVYQFPGTCEYNLVSDCHGPMQSFSVHVRRAGTSLNPQITRVLVTIGDMAIELTKGLVMINKDIVTLPHYVAGVLLEENSVYTKLYAKLGLSVTWNKDDAVMVELDTKYSNRTCGLCGDFNGIAIYNEFLIDARVISSIEFGNKHKVHSPNNFCEDPYEELVDDQSKVDKCQKFRSDCSQLLEDKSWSSCRMVLSAEPYIQACMLDMCHAQPGDTEHTEPLCTTLSEYSRQCSHAGGTPPNWRTPTFCEVQCPFNMVYSESGSPCMDTCIHTDTSSLCEEHKMDGCFCPPGTVFDDISKRGCVAQEKCQCKHNQVYNPGDVLLKGDEECVCDQGRWNCKTLSIPALCAVEEGSHFTTYDGKKFTFHGNCYYVLSKDCVDSKFIILGQLIPCVTQQTDTCLKSIALLLNKDRSNVLIIKDDGIVRHNGEITLPYKTTEFTVFRPSSFNIILQTSFGLQIQVQLVPLMQLYITLDQSFQSKTCGLCGNFNMVLSDELKTPQGLVEGTAASFGNSWKAQSNCPDSTEMLDDPCSYNIDSESYAEHWCSKLKDKEEPFAKCHSTVNPENYYKRCKYSSCTCEKSEDCLCAVFSSYARACMAKGVFLQGWRNTVCERYAESCPASQVFSYTLQGCQRTCDSLSSERQGCSTDFVPVDGCACPDGLYEDKDGFCVPMDKCPCYHNGEHINSGKSINIKNEHCVCTNGKLHCHSWRSRIAECPEPKVFFNCTAAGPDEHGLECAETCAQENIDCFLADCESGCQCPKGLLDDGRGHCVKKHDCPCKHNDHFYAGGSEITDECNTCTCKQGKWECTNKKCPGTCTIYGSGHYNTFDKQTYGFSGDCGYIAVQNKCGSKTGTFRVTTENVPCGTTGTTCSKSVRIFLGNRLLELKDGNVTYHELETGPVIKFTVRNVGLYLVIETYIGLSVLWDRKTTVRIILQPQHMGEVCGLCGNYNGNGKDDFITQGQLQVSDVMEFVNSWKVYSLCPDAVPDFDPCIATPNRHTWAKMQCSIIKSDTFKDCHSEVDATPYFDNCVRDSCACDTGGDCECFCTAVAAYAQACNEAGVCVAWRTPEICPVFCDFYNHHNECIWHYSPCDTPCYKTCLSPTDICTNPLPNLEGCYPKCPEDKPIFDEKNQMCVEKCEGCFINGTEYEEGEEIPSKIPCSVCHCGENGEISCSQRPGCCFYNGTEYGEDDVIYNVTDNMGTCYYAICLNSTVIESSLPCPPTTLPPTLSTPITSTLTTEALTTTELPFTSTTPFIETVSSTTFISTGTTAETPTTGYTETSTTRVTESTSTTESETTPCVICEWSEWFNVYNPTTGGGHDLETYENIKNSDKTICEHPEDIECRAVVKPDVPFDEFIASTGQVVQCNVSFGLVCEQEKQPERPYKCFDYKIRVLCCGPCIATSTPPPGTASTSIGTTQTLSTSVVTTESTTSQLTTTTGPPISTTPAEDITTTIPLEPTSTSEKTTKATTTPVITTESTTSQQTTTGLPGSPSISTTPAEVSTTPKLTEPTSTSEKTTKATTTPVITTESTTSQQTTTSLPGSPSTSTTPAEDITTTVPLEPTSTSEKTTKATTTPVITAESTTSQQTTTSLPGSPSISTTPAEDITTTVPLEPTSTSEKTTKATTTPVITTESTTSQQTTTSSPGSPSISTTPAEDITTTVPLEPTSTSEKTTKATTTPVITTESTTSQQTTTSLPGSPSISTTPAEDITTTVPLEPTSTSEKTTKATTTPVITAESTTSQQTTRRPPGPTTFTTTTPPVGSQGVYTSSTNLPEVSTTVQYNSSPVITTQVSTTVKVITTTEPPSTTGKTTKATTTPVITTESTTSQQTTTSSPESPGSPSISTTPAEGTTTTIPLEPTSTSEKTTKATTTPVITTESTTSQHTISTGRPVVSTTPVGTTAETPTTGYTETSTTRVTEPTSTTESETTPCVICEWSEWFNVYNPTTGGGHDLETYENIKNSGKTICEHPEDIECRAVVKPDVPFDEFIASTGQVVQCNVSFGLVCEQEKQPERPYKCFDYKIRVLCCGPCNATSTPPPGTASTSIGTTQTLSTSVVTTESTTSQLTTTTGPPISTTPAEDITTTIPLEPTSTSEKTTKATTTPVITTESTTSQQTTTSSPESPGSPSISTTPAEDITTTIPLEPTSTSEKTTKATTTPVITTESTTSQQTTTSSPESPGSPSISTTPAEDITTTIPLEPTSTSEKTTKATTTPVITTESTTSQQTTRRPPGPTTFTTTTPPVGSQGVYTSSTSLPEVSTTVQYNSSPVITTQVSTTVKVITTTEPPSTIGKTTKATTTPVITTESTTSQQTTTSSPESPGSPSISTPAEDITTTVPLEPTSTSEKTTKATTTPVITTESTTSQQTTTSSPESPGSPSISTTPAEDITTTIPLEPTFTSEKTTKATTTPVITTESTTSQQTTTGLPGSPSISTTPAEVSTTPKLTEPTSTSEKTTKATTTPVITTESTTSQQTTTSSPGSPSISTTPAEDITTTVPLEPTSTSEKTTKATTTPVITAESTTSQQTTTSSPGSPSISTTPAEDITTTVPLEPTSTSEKTTKATTTPVITTESTTSQQTTRRPPGPTTFMTQVSTTVKVITTTEPPSTTGKTTKATTTPVITTESTTSQQTTTSSPESPGSPSISTTPAEDITPTIPLEPTSTSEKTTKATTTPVITTESTTSQQTTTSSPESPGSPSISTTPAEDITPTIPLEPTSTSEKTTKATTTPVITTESTTSQQTTTSSPGSPSISTTPAEDITTTIQVEPTSTSEKTTKATTTPVITTESTTSQQTTTSSPESPGSPSISTTPAEDITTTIPLEPTSTSEKTTKATTTPVITTESTTSQQTTTSSPGSPSISTTPAEVSTTPKLTEPPSTTEKTTKTSGPITTPCFCVINGKHYKPGETIISNADIGSGICLTMICSNNCVIQNTTQICPTPSTSPPPSKNCSDWGVGENEVFEICNCTWARCIEDNIVEIIPYECPPPKNITCSNRKTPVLVPDESHCCEEYACDCFCEGWGDPHYITFDGLFYSFQGECTYVLFEEMRPKHHLKIYIDNINCDPLESVSCPRAIIVSYKTQVITLKNNNLIGEAKLEALLGHTSMPLPFVTSGIKVLDSGLNFILEIPQLGVVVMFGVTGFSVTLPFRHFGNNTQGHCGTCNNNKDDDCMLPGGKLVNDCALMANYWPAKDLYNPECPEPPLLPPTAAPTKPPCPVNPVCELLKSDVFKACHPFVSPENYFTGCQFDSCHMSNPAVVCTSLQTYALTCSQFGICINWRIHSDLCAHTCPKDKVYKPCGPAEPPTCKDRIGDQVVNVTTEGCFCPEGTLLFSKESGVCVDKCGCLDSGGNAREFGEKFEYMCQDCVCNEPTQSVICKPRQCSNNNQITCSEPGNILVNVTDPEDDCCTMLSCRCDSGTCPIAENKCKIGYIPVLTVPDGKCCPEYTCEPKKVCVHRNMEYKPGTTIPVVDCQECHCTWNVDPQTLLYRIQCGFVTCNETCEPGHEYVETSSDECCGNCVRTMCVFNYKGKTQLLKSGKEWTPKNEACDRFICDYIDGEYVVTNYKIHCPSFNIDNCQPGTVQFAADGCCQTCVEKDKGCKVQTVVEHITHNNCKSKSKVEQTHCQGHCNSYSMYSEAGSSSCSCCQASRSSNRTVSLDCLNGDTISHTYVHVEECSCDNTKCLSNTYSRKGQTLRKRSSKIP